MIMGAREPDFRVSSKTNRREVFQREEVSSARTYREMESGASVFTF